MHCLLSLCACVLMWKSSVHVNDGEKKKKEKRNSLSRRVKNSLPYKLAGLLRDAKHSFRFPLRLDWVLSTFCCGFLFTRGRLYPNSHASEPAGSLFSQYCEAPVKLLQCVSGWEFSWFFFFEHGWLIKPRGPEIMFQLLRKNISRTLFVGFH